jgi:predicted nucleic acid-binding protein
VDIHRAQDLSERSLRYPDAVHVAAAERHQTALLTVESRIGTSGAPVRCRIITIVPDTGSSA